jgi:hypothetical protein
MANQATWEAAVQRWLPVVFPALRAHAVRLGAGDRGVLVVTIDADEADRQLAGGTFAMTPAWHPADAFIGMVKRPEGVGPEAAGRWAISLAVMDPAHDVALFLTSTPDASGAWFSRFVVTNDGTVAADPVPAFLEAHVGCPDRVEWLIWVPTGRSEAGASVTLTCACGGRLEATTDRVMAAALLVTLRAHGFPVRALEAAPGIQ